jgi:hypothetical protein
MKTATITYTDGRTLPRRRRARGEVTFSDWALVGARCASLTWSGGQGHEQDGCGGGLAGAAGGLDGDADFVSGGEPGG